MTPWQLLPLRCSHDAPTKAKEAVVTRRQRQLGRTDKNVGDGRDASMKAHGAMVVRPVRRRKPGT